jgi:hypothetical protein
VSDDAGEAAVHDASVAATRQRVAQKMLFMMNLLRIPPGDARAPEGWIAADYCLIW